ncbi:MAG TPA: cbb3-type cytochrome c oxidase N-terminal domain-containing protein, partial [Vicinamibacterales bacterium]|nr:cbb3-type cytochrome c oxidase N-terminal domain-containing protein [Vicinamibacterales bacterium]
MSQFTSDFWDLYIAGISLASIIACGVFLKMQSVVRKTGKTDTTGHTWDEDLSELDNPLPRWWAWLFYLTIAFSLVYLVLYPGLGSYRGTLGWSQIGQLEEENKVANAEFGPLYDKFAKLDVAALAK